jgi:phosphoribosylanthranilate isomerase
MIAGIRLKVCGLRTLVDAEAADAIGADYLGFILWPASPRFVALEQWRAMSHRLPDRKKVAVGVLPERGDLESWCDAGFDRFQLHFPLETPEATIEGWSSVVGRGRLWLAPKLPPDTAFPEWILPYACTVVVDTFADSGFGGTGRTGNWPAFRALRESHPETEWVLAGGLSPANIAEALAATGARMVDVNSGVEAAPGVKDPARLRELAVAMGRQRA